jgi:uncharacterized membrane protein HdeD (DUF308 family)
MRVEALLFAGTCVFFAIVATVYGLLSRDPAGTAVLAVSGAMALVISFYFGYRSHRFGPRPQDRHDADIADGAGPVAFFSPRSHAPLGVALAASILALGIVFGLWLTLLGAAMLAASLLGLVFQHVGHPD